MKKLRSPRSLTPLGWFSLAALFLGLSLHAQQSGQDVNDDGAKSGGKEKEFADKVVAIKVSDDDVTDARRFRHLRGALEQAAEEEAVRVILEIDVAAMGDSEVHQRVAGLFDDLDMPAVGWVHHSATGAGVLIALGCREIYVSSGAVIGGAGIALPEGDDEDEAAARRKALQEVSVLRARARGLASRNGHRPEVAEAFVDSRREVKVGDKVLSPEGDTLTLTAEEAVAQDGEGPLFAMGMASSLEELTDRLGLDAEVVEITPRAYGEKKNLERVTRAGGAKDADEKAEGGAESESPTGLFSRRESRNLKDRIVVIEIGQDALATGKARFEFMDRILKKAELDGARAVILDVDTPGGYAWYTKGLVLDSLQNVSIPTYTFVNPRAESAGAIIALGTDHIYMRPAASIGSALVVSGTGQDLAPAMDDKVTQMIIATVRNIAELKGHNPDVAEAFVTQDKEVKIDGVVVHESGNVLNLNTIQATEVIGGKPVLAKGVARDLEDLIAQEGLEGELLSAEPLGMEAFAHWVQKFSFLLILVGLAGAYVELNSPGFGLPGLLSVLCFALFFFGNYLAGNLAGYELAVLFALGLVLIFVEIFIFPGALVPGVVGGFLVVGSLGFAMVDRVDFEWKREGLPTTVGWGDLFHNALFSLAVGIAGALVAMFALMRYLPDSRMGRWLVLEGAVPQGASIDSGGRPANADSPGEVAARETFLGWEGEAVTDLRPDGKGRFRDRLLDLVTEGEFIAKGEKVVVAKHEGSRIVARRA